MESAIGNWSRICSDLLFKLKNNKHKLLVIIDGLDESTDPFSSVWIEIFGNLPSGVKVIFSARFS